jgi:4-hydroxyphenylpyruvate dioxygenase
MVNINGNPLFINTVLLGGTTEEKIVAARDAGFDQIELWRQDIDVAPGGAGQVRDVLNANGVGLTDFQVLLDFDGAPDARRAQKRAEALRMLDTAVRVGATTLLTPASTDPSCEPDRIVEDLRWLAAEAGRRGLRIAYEGMAWSSVNCTTPAAWKCVLAADMPNLGMVIDAFHIFVRGRDAGDFDGIPVERIYLVQLSDLAHALKNLNEVKQIARHERLLPGAGCFPVASLVARLKAGGYRGPVGLEVFNDAMKARDPVEVAREAMAALRRAWD